jgi:hypothetical protein
MKWKTWEESISMSHKKFLEFLAEEKLNAPKKTYDKTIFGTDDNGKTILRDTVWKNLVAVVDRFDELVPIEGAYVIGPICTKKYDEKTPVVVAILIDSNDINHVIHDRLLSVADQTNRGLVADTLHPLKTTVELIDGREGLKKWLAAQTCCFDISSNKWEKEMTDIGENIKIALVGIKKREPNDLVFFGRENPVTSAIFVDYSKEALEQIKKEIKNRLFDLTREANGKATTTIEKNFIKAIIPHGDIDPRKLEAKFITNEVSNDVALNLLRQKYYYEILQMIADTKSDQSLENDFDEELAVKNNAQKFAESQHRHPTFSEFILTEDGKHLKKLKKLKQISDTIEPGSGGKKRKSKAKQHENRGLKNRQNMQRKLLRQLAAYRELTASPQDQISDEFSCRSLIQNAKEKPRGFWPLTAMQAQWIASVYHFDMPTKRDRIKRLSNMPMALFKPKRGGFFLVKDERLLGIT